MVRHMGHWLDVVEAVVIIGVLLLAAYLAWQALVQAWAPVFNIVPQL